jgi:hypothetical protein
MPRPSSGAIILSKPTNKKRRTEAVSGLCSPRKAVY